MIKRSEGLMTSDEVDDLKKQLQKFKPKTNKPSSDKLSNSINTLTKKVDAMHKSINETPHKFKVGRDDGSINEKFDKLLEQNNIIAGGIVAISKMIEDFTEKREKPVPRQDFSKPSFQPPKSKPSFNEPPTLQQQELSRPKLDQSPKPQQQKFEPTSNEPPFQKQKPPESRFDDLLPSNPELPEPPSPQQQGPVAMPSIPFSNIEKPKKKGLFGFFKK